MAAISAKEKWHTCDQKLIETLGRPIEHPMRGKMVSGLIVAPGSTPAQIKPLFDARIKELRTQIRAADDEYFSISDYICRMEVIEEKIRRSIGVLPSRVFPGIAARRKAMFDRRDSEWCKSFRLEQEITVLENRFEPALNLYKILQKA